MRNPISKTEARCGWLLALLSLLLPGCLLDGSSREDDLRKLAAMGDEIEALVSDPMCSDSTECAYIAFGAKPCGGPWRYLIYSPATVDETVLEEKVAEYNRFEDTINRRYGLVSDCSVPRAPRLGCLDGVCVDLNEFLDTRPFVRLAQRETCAEISNSLFVIDEELVFWDRRGDCADDASYAWVLFGRTVDDILMLEVNSTRAPVYCDPAGYSRDVREIFATIADNLDETDLGLGPGHTVREVAVTASGAPPPGVTGRWRGVGFGTMDIPECPDADITFDLVDSAGVVRGAFHLSRSWEVFDGSVSDGRVAFKSVLSERDGIYYQFEGAVLGSSMFGDRALVDIATGRAYSNHLWFTLRETK
jgi:hypothetical protein